MTSLTAEIAAIDEAMNALADRLGQMVTQPVTLSTKDAEAILQTPPAWLK
jgi:hypothetical protein